MERREAKLAKREGEPGPSGISRWAPGLSSGVSRWAPSSENVMYRESSTNGISCWQPSPNSVGRGGPSPSSVGRGGPSPSSVGRGGPSPSSVGRVGPSPSSVGRGGPSPNSVGRGGPSPNSVGRGGPSSNIVGHGEITDDRNRSPSAQENRFLNDVEIADSASDNAAATSSESDSSEESSSQEEAVDATWSPKKASSSYKYTKLVDLQPGLKRINVIGVVKEFSAPRQTRGAQHNSVVTVVDESNPLVGVKAVLFNSNVEKLPQVKREGDIVCLHRVNTNDFRNVLQIEGPPFSSSMRFTSKVGGKMTPKTGSLSYTFSATERKRVRQLRQWVLQRKRNSQTQKLESVREGLKFGLLCQVVWIGQPPSVNETILSVWDGTICPLPSKPCPFSSDHVSSDPSLNTTVGPELQQQITIEGRASPKLKMKPGSYVFIGNVETSLNAESGDTELCVRGKMTKNVELVSPREACHSDLKERLEVALAAQDSITHTPHDGVNLTTLQEVKDCSNDQEFTKFHCKAKLVSVLTPCLEDTVHLFCEQCKTFKPISQLDQVDVESGLSAKPCVVCTEAGDESPPPRCLYCVRLLLRDNSGSLEVNVVHDEAVALFRGLKPTNFYKDQALRFKLMKMLYLLSGGNAPFCQEEGEKFRPWIECCLLKAVGHAETCYFLFDTSIVGQS